MYEWDGGGCDFLLILPGLFAFFFVVSSDFPRVPLIFEIILNLSFLFLLDTSLLGGAFFLSFSFVSSLFSSFVKSSLISSLGNSSFNSWFPKPSLFSTSLFSFAKSSLFSLVKPSLFSLSPLSFGKKSSIAPGLAWLFFCLSLFLDKLILALLMTPFR